MGFTLHEICTTCYGKHGNLIHTKDVDTSTLSHEELAQYTACLQHKRDLVGHLPKLHPKKQATLNPFRI